MKKLIIAAATAFSLALTAQAQDKATLDLLVKKGLITQTEADELIKAKAEGPAPVTSGQSALQKVSLGGALQARYSYINTNEKKGANDPADANGFMARRVILQVGAKFNDEFSLLFVPEFDSTRSAPQQSYLNIAVLRYALAGYGTLSMGFQKVNFGLEEYVSPPALDNPVVEYSAATLGLVTPFASRHLGVYWDGAVKDTGIRYGAAVTNSATDLWNTGGAAPAGTANASNNELAYWANVAYDYTHDKDTKVTVGLNTGWVGDTGTNNAYIFGYNPFVKFCLGKLALTGEVIGWAPNGVDGMADQNSWGYNLTATYKVTESIEPVVRFSQYEGDGRRLGTGTLVYGSPNTSSTYDNATAVYAGFNWYITPKSLKVQTGYEFTQLTQAANASSQVDSHAFRTQVQAVF